MFYKFSILAAIFALLSMDNAIATELSQIEGFTAEQQSEPAPNLQPATAQNSASIAKAQLLKTPTPAQASANTLTTKTPSDKNSASIAKARLQNLSSKETLAADSLAIAQPNTTGASPAFANSIPAINTPDQIVSTAQLANASPNSSISDINDLNQTTAQQQIAAANAELNAIEQWEINKSVTLADILLTPASDQTIAQAPARLPDSSISAPVIETQKPVIAKPTVPAIGTQKPVTTTTEPQIIEAKKPEPQNNEPKKWAVGVHTQLSTTGFIGVDAGYKFSPNLHARLGLNTVGFNLDYASEGIDYKAKFNPTNVHLLGDFFPFGGGLRLTGGLVFQSNQFDATGTPNSSTAGGITQVNIGNEIYNINQVGTITSEGSFSNSVAPYLGIGFGTPLSPGLGFNFDAGVMFAGSPKVKLRANIPSSVPANIQADIRNSLDEQERRTNNDISSFGIYPVISVGLSYAF